MTLLILGIGRGGCQTAASPLLSRIISSAEDVVEFSALFLGVLVVMLAAWFGSRMVALALFGLVLIASAATLLHHATDTLKLSF
jgi:hypothetical protein